MQVLLNTDNNIQGTIGLTDYVETEVKRAVDRFGDRMTRVEVHVTDQNSREKDSESDKRCLMEARIAGHAPVVVSHEGATIQQAVEGAADKLQQTLDRSLGKQKNRKGNTPIGGDPSQGAL